MDLDRIRVFTKVVQEGGFSAAARRLDMPKSKVSRWVSELEAQLGTRLLHRTTRQLSLTDAGRVYFERTHGSIVALESANRALDQLQEQPSGTLRVTVPTDLASTTLLPVYQRYCRLYEQVRLVILVSNRQVDLVAEGVDLAVRAGQLADSTLVSRRLASTTMGLFASPAYLEQAESLASLADLARHNCLVFGNGSLTHTWRLAGPGGSQEVTVRGNFSATDYGTLRSACLAGMGIAQLPTFDTWKALQDNQLKAVLPVWKGRASTIHAVYASGNQLAPAVRKFVDLLVEHFEGLQGRVLETA